MKMVTKGIRYILTTLFYFLITGCAQDWHLIEITEISDEYNQILQIMVEDASTYPEKRLETVFTDAALGRGLGAYIDLIIENTNHPPSSEGVYAYLGSDEAIDPDRARELLAQVRDTILGAVDFTSLSDNLDSDFVDITTDLKNHKNQRYLRLIVAIAKASGAFWYPTTEGGTGLGDPYRSYFASQPSAASTPNWVLRDAMRTITCVELYRPYFDEPFLSSPIEVSDYNLVVSACIAIRAMISFLPYSTERLYLSLNDIAGS